MTYRATMVVDRAHLRADDPYKRSTIIVRVAGCIDEDDALVKLRKLYSVVSFKKIEQVEESRPGETKR